MKKLKNIYHKIISAENLYQAAYMAARGRRYRDTTADFNFNLEEEIQRLRKELEMKTYKHGQYRVFTIYEPKERRIAAAPFRDRVVHHAVHDVIEPVIDKTFIYDSYACRKEKGTHKAVDRAQSFLRANKFCFHGDIKKYFPSIDHGILREILIRRIGDEDVMWLLSEVIDSAKELAGARVGELVSGRVCELAGLTRKHANSLTGELIKGLPIGNLTSQFFANLYLNELDYFVKFELKCRYYLRYMDDFLVFDNDKKLLLEIKDKIKEFLKNRLNIDLHQGKSQIYKTGAGIKFLGFRLFKNHRRLTSDNVRRFRKRLKEFSDEWRAARDDTKDFTIRLTDSVRCWTAHSKYANTGNLRFRVWRDLKKRNDCFAEVVRDILVSERVNPIINRSSC